jgi:hypothetical protein
MFDWIYQFLVSLAAKIFSWFGLPFDIKLKGGSDSSESVEASAVSDAPPVLPPSGPEASDLSGSFSSNAAVVA